MVVTYGGKTCDFNKLADAINYKINSIEHGSRGKAEMPSCEDMERLSKLYSMKAKCLDIQRSVIMLDEEFRVAMGHEV
jgi:hypothetical protein